MDGKRKGKSTNRGIRRVDLDKIQDTGGTTDYLNTEDRAHRLRDREYEELVPPFKHSGKQSDGNDMAYLFRNIYKVTAFILVILAGSWAVIWYASKIDSDVSLLKTEVIQVKAKTEELMNTSIRHGERLGNVEKTIDTNTNQKSSSKK